MKGTAQRYYVRSLHRYIRALEGARSELARSNMLLERENAMIKKTLEARKKLDRYLLDEVGALKCELEKTFAIIRDARAKGDQA